MKNRLNSVLVGCWCVPSYLCRPSTINFNYTGFFHSAYKHHATRWFCNVAVFASIFRWRPFQLITNAYLIQLPPFSNQDFFPESCFFSCSLVAVIAFCPILSHYSAFTFFCSYFADLCNRKVIHFIFENSNQKEWEIVPHTSKTSPAL